jgi:hypothetical protein
MYLRRRVVKAREAIIRDPPEHHAAGVMVSLVTRQPPAPVLAMDE